MRDQKLSPVVDADGHVLEPGDMYQNYIDPQYRDRTGRAERVSAIAFAHKSEFVSLLYEDII